jgi:hypothetical protein
MILPRGYVLLVGAVLILRRNRAVTNVLANAILLRMSLGPNSMDCNGIKVQLRSCVPNEVFPAPYGSRRNTK